MENENDLDNFYQNNPYYANLANIARDTNRIDPKEPDFDSPRKIELPERFKDVVKKMCPEIIDIVSVGYRESIMYNPETFAPIKKYLVGVDLYFNETNGMRKPKKEYNDELDGYFRMTFDEYDFITFHVQSFIFPPEKTNEDKFFELFSPKISNPIP